MSWLDWCVIAGYTALMLAVGMYYARRNKTGEDYMLGGRAMAPIAVGLSLFATFASTLSYLAWPGEMIAHGPMLLAQIFAYPLIIVIVGYGLIPLLMRQRVTSAYEILESRLGTSIRLAGAGVFLLLRLGWMATILYATSHTVLVPMWDLDATWTPWLCVALGVVTVMYSAPGGIRAVVVTDALQAVTMLAGAAITVGVITFRMGGVEAWWPHTWASHWEAPTWGFNPNARLSFGIVILSTTLWYVCTNGSDQMSIQRFLATRDVSAARKTLIVSMIADAMVTCLLALTGLALLGYYLAQPQEFGSHESLQSVADQLFPRFIMSGLPAGLSGLVIAAILAAAMSSLASGVNSTCAVISQDFLPQYTDAQPVGKAEVKRMRRLSFLVAMVAVALSMLNTLIQGNLIERCFKIVNLLTAPLFVLFFLALFVRWANEFGAWLGLTSSIAAAVLVAYSKDMGLDFGISFVWMMPCSLLVGVVVGMMGSAVAPHK